MYDICIYHKNCADGFTAAWVAHRAGVKEFHAADYGDNLDAALIADRHVLIADFSYPAATLRDMGALAKSVTVLDHHAPMAEELKEFEAGPAHLLKVPEGPLHRQESNIRAVFDNSKCGAMLTGSHLFPKQLVPVLIDYVQDRDLWQHRLPDTHEVSAYINSLPYTFEMWNSLSFDLLRHPSTVVAQGTAILRDRTTTLERLLPGLTTWMVIGGYLVPVANVMYHLASDAGHELCKLTGPGNVPVAFSATYLDRGDGKRKFSLRSHGDFDVSAVARHYNGNGHRNAAGFVIEAGWAGDGV